jgi:hypothetical protein
MNQTDNLNTITVSKNFQIFLELSTFNDRLCGLVVRVLTTDTGVPGSIPGQYKKK